MVNAPTGLPNLARRDDRRAAKRVRSSYRSSRRSRAGSAGCHADRPVAHQVLRSVSDRSTKSVRSGSTPAEHRTPDSGEGLRLPLPLDTAATGPDDEDVCGKAEWKNSIAASDQAR